MGFLKNAYDDYISARTLLNRNLILQGAILANTSIEKYFKAILTFKGDTVKHNHSIVGLLPSIKNYDKKLHDKLDMDFIEVIDKCYTLRYIDSAPANFKVVLLKKKTLAELDFIISLMHDKMLIKTDNREPKSSYQHDADSNRTELLENNFLFGQVTKEEYLLGLEDVYELTVDSNKNFIEVLYQTNIDKK
jgi:HEPN domain-containing protein